MRSGCSADHPDQWERAACRSARARARRRRGGAAVRADHAVHGADHGRRDRASRASRSRPGRSCSSRPGTPTATGSSRDTFDITAERPRARVLTFGAGIHYCVGANLARAEMQEGLAFLAENVARSASTGSPEFGTPSGIYGLEALPLGSSRLSASAASACHSASSPSGTRTACPAATSSSSAASAAHDRERRCCA